LTIFLMNFLSPKLLALAAAFALCFGQAIFAQKNAAVGKFPTEKSLSVDANASLSFCVADADAVFVRGWQRDEIRVLIEGGAIGFKILERGGANNLPVRIKILGFEPKPSAAFQSECLKGERIEIEVPEKASVGVKSPTSECGNITIDSIAKIKIESIGGNVAVRHIQQETDVLNFSGSIAAEDSSGKFAFKTIGGRIAAFRLKPNDSTDTLKINSNGGSIVLRDVKHKNIEAATTSGELSVINSLSRGGSYNFNTTSGFVWLEMPTDFPFQFRLITTANGRFNTDFPLKISTENNRGQTKVITAANGAGDTPINLTSFSGTVLLKKIQ
jgi:hypothetical protein